MRIIKSGKEAYNHKCENCGCLFEYKKNDIDIESKVDEYYSETHFTDIKSIKCPECSWIYFLEVKIDDEDYTWEWNN